MATSKKYNNDILDAFVAYEESGFSLPERGEEVFEGEVTITNYSHFTPIFGEIFKKYFPEGAPDWVSYLFDIDIKGETEEYGFHAPLGGGDTYYWFAAGKKFGPDGGRISFKKRENPLPLQRVLDEGSTTPRAFAQQAKELGFSEFSLVYAPAKLIGEIIADQKARDYIDLGSASRREDLSPDDAFECVAGREGVYAPELASLVVRGAKLNLRRLEQIESAEFTKYYDCGRLSVTEYISVMSAAEAAPDITTDRLAEAAEILKPHVWLKEGEDAIALAPTFKRWGGFKTSDAWLNFDHSAGHSGRVEKGELSFDHARMGDFSVFELFDDREAAIRRSFRGIWYGDILKLRHWEGYLEVLRTIGINPYPKQGGSGTPLAVPAKGLTRERVKEAVRRDGRCFRIRVDCNAEGRSKDGKLIPIDNLSKWLFGVPGRDGRGHIWVDEDGIHLPEATPQECIDLLREVVAKMK